MENRQPTGCVIEPLEDRRMMAAGIPRPDHVVIVVEENHSFTEVMSLPQAPYIQGLAGRGALFTQSFAITHPSQPNYLAMFSGSTHNITSNICPAKVKGANLGKELIDAGLTFAGFSEDLPAVGSRICISGDYSRKHVPWVNFGNVPRSANRPLTKFPTDFSKLPTLSYIIPNNQNNMHDGSVLKGDRWLRDHIRDYVAWAKKNNSLLIITFDEDNGGEGNRIPTLFVGPMVKRGSYSEHIDHYRLLRTLEDMFDLTHAGQAASATPITDVWKT